MSAVFSAQEKQEQENEPQPQPGRYVQIRCSSRKSPALAFKYNNFDSYTKLQRGQRVLILDYDCNDSCNRGPIRNNPDYAVCAYKGQILWINKLHLKLK